MLFYWLSERYKILKSFAGIACEADLVFVDNAADNYGLIEPRDYYKYTYATDALGFKYIFDYATQHHQPCVINFSEGSPQDFRGDEQLYYELLAGLTGPGRIIVSSAGNDGAKTTYIHKGIGKERAGTFLRGNQKSFGCTAKSRQPFMFRVSIYNKVVSPKTVDVSTVRVCSSKDSLLTDSILVDGKMYKWSVLAFPNNLNSG